jgi:hypothetical protein
VKHWHPPPGPVNAHTREWMQFRADVRAAAARWCDAPRVTRQEPEATIEEACGDCAACEAVDLVESGRA